jgi:peptidoglycan/LPS O-acetylase OafA/YrhL
VSVGFLVGLLGFVVGFHVVGVATALLLMAVGIPSGSGPYAAILTPTALLGAVAGASLAARRYRRRTQKAPRSA